MNSSTIITTLEIITITTLSLVGLFIIKYLRTAANTWTGIGLIFGVISYLVVDTSLVQKNWIFYLVVVTAAICIPVFFFLLTKAIFDDHFKPSWETGAWFALAILVHFSVYARGFISLSGAIQHICRIVSEIVSIGFVLAGIYTAISTRKTDLVEERRRFRTIFIIGTAALIGITLIVESMPVIKESTDILQILQRTAILGITLFFLFNNFEAKSNFFFREPSKTKTPSISDNQLRQKLDRLISETKAYRQEGLTIGELAKLLNGQEYKVRKLINGELGFRNFNDFLNTYRVQEACQILADPDQNKKTILEIAYELGYQSIGPFNKAFKELKGTTPTAYRKAH